MSAKVPSSSASSAEFTNGSGAAAILSAGVGSFMVALFALAADKSPAIKSHFIFYKPTGPLSGVTTSALLVWLLTWVLLEFRWSKRSIALARISAVSLALLTLSLLLTFPPIVDLF